MARLTAKQMAFARAFVEVGDARKAYEMAGYSQKNSLESQRVEACRLLKNPNVALMVESLQKEHAERHNITIDTITEMLKADRQLAHQMEQAGAAVSASMGLAKVHGLVVDRSKNETTVKREADELSDHELEAIAAGRGAGTTGQAESATEPDRVH